MKDLTIDSNAFIMCFLKPWPVKVGVFFMPFQTRFSHF